MKTSFRIYILLLIFILLFFTSVNASNINMDLSPYESNNMINESLSENTSNLTQNSTQVNTSNANLSANDISNTSRVTSVTTTSEDDNFLSVGNILSIMIIVIGILLIFLAIAILIRFK